MKQIAQLEINGDLHEFAVEPGDSLLSVLREQAGLKGAKLGCDSGGCGCCSVLVDGKVRYSCMTQVLAVQECAIVTIEGRVGTDELTELQQGFVKTGAVQCGYCTCGMIMAATQLLDEKPTPSDSDIRDGIAGNLCRCTGYTKIVEAIGLAAER